VVALVQFEAGKAKPLRIIHQKPGRDDGSRNNNDSMKGMDDVDHA
jgi:hypothetical protein